MSQTPITITYSLEEVLKEITGKLDSLQKDVNDLKVGQTRLEEKFTGEMKALEIQVKAVKEDVKELKGSAKAQIWTLIGIIVTIIGGFLVAVARFVVSGNP